MSPSSVHPSSGDDIYSFSGRSKGRTNHTVGCFYSYSINSQLADLNSKNTVHLSTFPRTISSHQSGNDSTPSRTINDLTNETPCSEIEENPCSPQSVAQPTHPHRAAVMNSKGKSTAKLKDQTDESKSTLQYNIAYQPKKTKIEKTYDMNLVPKVRKNREFLEKWRRLAEAERKSYRQSSSLPCLVPCDTSESSVEADTSSEKSTSSDCSLDKAHHPPKCNVPCHECLFLSDLSCNEQVINNILPLSPFAPESESVIWVPTTRKDWEDSIDEMVAVCSAAAWHKHRSRSSGCRKKMDFHPPISRIYIRDRIEIDDPLRGYQIRHKTGGWLQGFVMMTTYTTWTHYFKWDSCHSMNGIDHGKPKGMIDNGTLSAELQSQKRSGNPLAEGVVWPSIAEMSLVGALGCGEYLLQMALDDISRRGTYEYVVLEATENSRPFYEKFGFLRVGAVCKYGNEKDVVSENGDIQVVGYRHWTYANESEQRVDAHGGPSCMMALRVKPRKLENHELLCKRCKKRRSTFVDELSDYFISEKPQIERLGSSGRKRSASGNTVQNPPTCRPSKKLKVTRSSTTGSGRVSKAPVRLDDDIHDSKSRSCRQRYNSNSGIKQRLKSIRTRNSKNSSIPPVSACVTNTTFSNARGKDSNGIELRKQIIPAHYRSPKKQYYYNKVVTPKLSLSKEGFKSKYYFVINFDADTMMTRVIPLFLRGTFKGKREGRPKWKANVLTRGGLDEEVYLKSMDVITSLCSLWEIVPSYAVTKCANVKQESWDILT